MTLMLIDQAPLLAFLQEQVLPPLIQRKVSSKERLRIWSIGCQAGDEATTQALLLQSLLPAGSQEGEFTIFATDSDQAVLASARDFCYPEHLLPQLPETSIPFLQVNACGYQLHPLVRRQILFGSHLLLSQMPFPHLDLILCHDSWAAYTHYQQRVLFNRFAYALSPEGYLWLTTPAASEPDPMYYRRLEGQWPLYQRTSTPVDVLSFGWSKAEGERRASLLIPGPLSERDELLNASMEELQTALEDREMASEEVNQRYQELEQVHRDLEQIYRLKEDFLSMVSHEMRTPLTTLLLTTQSLQRWLRAQQGWTPENAAAFQRPVRDLETIEQMALQLSRHVADLLEAAHLHSDMFYLTQRPMDLVRLVRQIIAKPELVRANRVRLVSGLDTIIGTWDETRLEQVISNLLTNALKYSDASAEVVINLRYRFHAGQAQEVLISVRDQGRGISEEDIPRVFDRFYRTSKGGDDAHAHESLGLGLYISAEIIKRHGGRIWAESKPGRGSTFFVALPLTRSEMRFPAGAAAGSSMPKEPVSKHS